MQSAFKEKVLKLFESFPKMDKMGFLSSFFKTNEEDYTDAEYIDIDIVRSGEHVAPVLRDISNGAIAIADDVFTGKQVKPPVYKLARPVNVFDLLKRQPGENEYEAIGSWFGRLVVILKRAFQLMYGMLSRSIELQASQVLQTGTLTLTDDAGNTAYTLDFNAKATHIATVGTKWDQSGADPIGDLNGLADYIRADGLVDPKTIIFGAKAWDAFSQDAKVQNAVKKDGLGLGNLSPRLVNKGGKYMGYLESGAYRYDLWVYNGRYQAFNDNTSTPFVNEKKVIMLADVEDLDFRLVYGGVPSLGMVEPFVSVVPDTVIYQGGMKVHNKVYNNDDKDTTVAQATTRPVCIPVSIDRFGCLTVLS